MSASLHSQAGTAGEFSADRIDARTYRTRNVRRHVKAGSAAPSRASSALEPRPDPGSGPDTTPGPRQRYRQAAGDRPRVGRPPDRRRPRRRAGPQADARVAGERQVEVAPEPRPVEVGRVEQEDRRQHRRERRQPGRRSVPDPLKRRHPADPQRDQRDQRRGRNGRRSRAPRNGPADADPGPAACSGPGAGPGRASDLSRASRSNPRGANTSPGPNVQSRAMTSLTAYRTGASTTPRFQTEFR